MKMQTVTFKLVGVSQLSFSHPVPGKKKADESHDEYEKRTWRERLPVNAEGNAYITPMAVKICLEDVARYVSESIKGKGKATYTKHFKSGIMVMEPMILDPLTTRENVDSETLFVPSDGKRGGGSRVYKTFPLVAEGWKVTGTLTIIDPILQPEKVKEYLDLAGILIGFGRFRAQNGGYYGRFNVDSFKENGK